MSLKVKTVKPVYGVNYSRGYMGFTWRGSSFISRGIAWFTRWENLSDIKVSHCFIVTGLESIIEAQPEGVVMSGIERYFNDPKILVFFRKPRDLGDAEVELITKTAALHVGHKYGYALIAAHAFNGSFFGRLLGKLTGGWVTRKVVGWLDNKQAEVCSELAATCLQACTRYKTGVLTQPASMIKPLELFEDQAVFDHWKVTPKE